MTATKKSAATTSPLDITFFRRSGLRDAWLLIERDADVIRNGKSLETKPVAPATESA